VVLGVLLLSDPASASKEVVASFGGAGVQGGQFGTLQSTEAGHIAVNTSGAGPADARDIYVIDKDNHRVQRFATDENGTPGDPYDDSFEFVSAWGADADATPDGGSDYELCTVAEDCQQALASAGNGTAAGNGALSGPSGLAIDQDTGEIYVSDTANNRINVYSGDGAFLRSFGADVVASGPGDAGSGYEVCVAANGDVCQGGSAGAGAGQIDGGVGIAVSPADGNPASGTVFLADGKNLRVNTYGLDGGSPSSFGSVANFATSEPRYVAVDSRGIVYASDHQNEQEIERYDSENANGGGVGFLAPIAAPPLVPSNNNGTTALQVDPDSDGAGPDEDVLYVLRTFSSLGVRTVIQQFGPLNDPGLTSAPLAADDVHGQAIGFSYASILGVDDSSGRLFVATQYGTEVGVQGNFVYALDPAGGAPSASLNSISGITPTSATVSGTVNPNGAPPVTYRLEYSLNGSDWTVDPGTETVLGIQATPQAISAVLDPAPFGLLPSTEYHVRIAAIKVFNPPVLSAPTTFTTAPGPPLAETTGAPLRSTSTAQLGGRVVSRGSATTYHFEYGDQGPCDVNPCASTPDRAAGAGQLMRLVTEQVDGLSPATTYHYRLVAGNGAPGSPGFGEDMTVTTRASDAPLAHGNYPGPPGSDRAYEQVSTADTSGNPVIGAYGFAADGNRALYSVGGGTPLSVTGSIQGPYVAERPAGQHPQSGWDTPPLMPGRDDLVGGDWLGPGSDDRLSAIFGVNAGGASEARPFFRMSPGGEALELYEPSQADWGGSYAISADGSRVVAALKDSHDPNHPTSGLQLYELNGGDPSLVSILPGGAACSGGSGLFPTGGGGILVTPPTARWISDDGSLVFFKCQGILVRDLVAGATTFIDSGEFIKSTTDGAVFYYKAGNIYRYELEGGTRSCVTCVIPSFELEVSGNGERRKVAVAEDGSRVYFKSPHALVPGAAAGGIYRVSVPGGELAYVAHIGSANVGEEGTEGQAMAADGSTLVFRSAAASLDALGGQQNGGTFQYYLYDDEDRSLVCASCPQDGTAPVTVAGFETNGNLSSGGANTIPVSDDGIFAFSTASPLLAADQNTPSPSQDPGRGGDLYEYRDGRLLLISDGLTDYPRGFGSGPRVTGVSPSGRDVFFLASLQLTPDALESSQRLYTARIGGGIDFPPGPRPCPLEVCQGTPQGAPEEAAPGTRDFSGPGNPRSQPSAARCPKGKRKVRQRGKVRCVKPQKQHKSKRNQAKANHDRRASR